MSTTSVLVSERSAPIAPHDLESVCRIRDTVGLTHALARLTHYAVLNIQPKASQAQIKESYRALAKRFHPDKVLDKNEKARYERIIARVIEAYSILSNATARENYNRKLLRRTSMTAGPSCRTPDSAALKQQASVLLKKGRRFRLMGDPWNAVQHLRNALKLEPQNPDIHYELGLAMSKNAKWRREVESAFLAAIRLDSWNAKYYVALGDFYLEQGLNVRAGREYKRAVWLDPDNAVAKTKLDELLTGRKSKSALGNLKRLLSRHHRSRSER